jgi:glycosidase/predicted alpha/beta superfamily hydrolase
MKMTLVRVLAASCLVAGAAAGQAPVIEKVDPPNWWTGSTINPVRVLIRGRNLTGARVECARVRCAGLLVNAPGTYAFVDVTISGAVRPGHYPFTLRTPSGSAEVPFELTAPLEAAGRFQGFGKDDVIYLVMPDRFSNGDPSNDDPAVSRGLMDRGKSRFYHGGDLAGVRQRLPYLKSLGITAIWLNPIYDNNNELNTKEVYDGQPITDYHGYGATDFYAVEEHFGNLREFRDLVDAAHAQGIKIILDMVANHTGPFHPWVTSSPTPTWFNGTAEHHLANTWQTWTLADPHGTAAVRETTLKGWFANILPDLNQDDPEVARYIIQNSLWWVAVSGLDGIRQDTWPYVPRRFWRDWMTALRREFPALRVVGEVWDGDPALVSFFEGGRPQFDGIDDKVDMLFDFPLFYPIRRAFGEGGHLREVAQMLSHDRLYRNPASLVTFLGLHDVSRFMNDKGATPAGLKLAYTLLLTTRGTPLLYYGDEIGLPGGGDPDNRRDFPGGWREDARNAFETAGRTAEEQSIYSHLQTLLKLRAEHPDLRGAATEDLVTGEQVFVYRRGKLVVALNNDTAQASVRLPLGTLGPDLLGLCATPRIEGNAPVVVIPKRTGCIFPVTAETIPGPALGVMGDRRLHPNFPSQFVAPRNVEVWLPPGYATHSAEHYPVLYMHDGQNVFDPTTSFGGVDWAADETMTRLIRERKVRPAIVVAIWNTAKRYQEYMPQQPLAGTTSHSTGFGSTVQNSEIISDAYLKFLVTELKPFIDRTYRTKTGRDDTFTMGASMGGLISAYAVIQYPEVFGGAGCLSTGWPVADGAVIEYLRHHAPDPRTHRFYFDLGTATLDSLFPPWQARADSALRASGYVAGRSFVSRTFLRAEHNERAWRDRLEIPLVYLLKP